MAKKRTASRPQTQTPGQQHQPLHPTPNQQVVYETPPQPPSLVAQLQPMQISQLDAAIDEIHDYGGSCEVEFSLVNADGESVHVKNRIHRNRPDHRQVVSEEPQEVATLVIVIALILTGAIIYHVASSLVSSSRTAAAYQIAPEVVVQMQTAHSALEIVRKPTVETATAALPEQLVATALPVTSGRHAGRGKRRYSSTSAAAPEAATLKRDSGNACLIAIG